MELLTYYCRSFLQLHGDGSRSALPIVLQENRIIYVLHADENGNILNHVPDKESSMIDWLLVDSAKGGRLNTSILVPFLMV